MVDPSAFGRQDERRVEWWHHLANFPAFAVLAFGYIYTFALFVAIQIDMLLWNFLVWIFIGWSLFTIPLYWGFLAYAAPWAIMKGLLKSPRFPLGGVPFASFLLAIVGWILGSLGIWAQLVFIYGVLDAQPRLFLKMFGWLYEPAFRSLFAAITPTIYGISGFGHNCGMHRHITANFQQTRDIISSLKPV